MTMDRCFEYHKYQYNGIKWKGWEILALQQTSLSTLSKLMVIMSCCLSVRRVWDFLNTRHDFLGRLKVE